MRARAGVGYQRKGYNWHKSIRRYKRTGSFKNVTDGSGHVAGEKWADQKQINMYSRQQKYGKNSPSFDEGVYRSKEKRRKSVEKALESVKNNIYI